MTKINKSNIKKLTMEDIETENKNNTKILNEMLENKIDYLISILDNNEIFFHNQLEKEGFIFPISENKMIKFLLHYIGFTVLGLYDEM